MRVGHLSVQPAPCFTSQERCGFLEDMRLPVFIVLGMMLQAGTRFCARGSPKVNWNIQVSLCIYHAALQVFMDTLCIDYFILGAIRPFQGFTGLDVHQ